MAMRYLHIAWDGAGNVAPQLALCQRLVAEGHQVTCIVEPGVRPAFEAIGADCLLASADPRPEGLQGQQEMFDTFRRYTFGRSWADDLLDGIDRVGPDRLLVDGMLWGAAAAAESAKLPTALLWHSLFTTLIDSPFADLFETHFGEAHAATRADLGLGPVDHVTHQLRTPDWLLAFTYQAIERPPTEPWPNLHYVGAAVPTSDTVDVELPSGTDPLVVVSFSTADMGQLPVLQRIVDALAALPVRVLVTVGPALEAGDLALPANAAAVSYVPHDQVLPEASVLISHMGHGTLAAGVRNGVPLVAVPMGRDQHANAAVVEALGIGRMVDAAADPTLLAEAAGGILADEAARRRAQALAAEVAAAPTVEHAVDLVTSTVPRSP